MRQKIVVTLQEKILTNLIKLLDDAVDQDPEDKKQILELVKSSREDLGTYSENQKLMNKVFANVEFDDHNDLDKSIIFNEKEHAKN